jgi:PleD family two-component response regulator
MFRSKLEMPGQELNHLDVLIPVDLGNQFDPPEEVQPVEASAEGVHAEGVPAVSLTEPGSEVADDGEPSAITSVEDGKDSIVVLEYDDGDRQLMVEAMAFTGYQVVEGTLNADIKELFTGNNVRLVLIGSMDADDRELAVCIKINAMRQDAPPPIIMSAHRWTRTAVLKALKYGAREIIIKPCGEDELAAKVRRFCKLPPS